jgi:monoamine oxidase
MPDEATQQDIQDLADSGQGSPVREPLPEEVLDVPAEGLGERPQPPKRVIVIGGGIAGLVAAFELRRQGHDPVVLEAQHRVGGRVYTLREFAPGIYAEAGAMRIPRVHTLTLEYCELFGLEMRPFVMGNPKTFVHLNGQKMTFAEADAQPDLLPFALADHERGKTWTELWNSAVQDVIDLYQREGENAFNAMLEQYDQYSIREFLELKGFSEGAIELYGVMSFRESNMNAAIIEQLREIVGRAFEDMQEIAGGMDRLPNAFFAKMPECVRFGAEVHAIEQDGNGVTVHYRTRATSFSIRGDYAIVAIPFSVLRDVEVTPAFSRPKQKAIRELNYNASTKVLFQTRTRFWEDKCGIVGGTSATDLPIRRLVYPSYSDPSVTRGALLASYTWGQDALRWDAMDPDKRVEQAIEDVSKIHPEIVDEFELGASHAWYDDPYAAGAFALFEPEQNTRLQADIESPEGRVLFAGEHCSLYHAWIQGALESGIRCAKAIHEAPAVLTPQPE